MPFARCTLEDMGRRIALIVGLTLALVSTNVWLSDGWAQRKFARVGILHGFGVSATAERFMKFSESFRRRLAKEGWIGQEHFVRVSGSGCRSLAT